MSILERIPAKSKLASRLPRLVFGTQPRPAQGGPVLHLGTGTGRDGPAPARARRGARCDGLHRRAGPELGATGITGAATPPAVIPSERSLAHANGAELAVKA